MKKAILIDSTNRTITEVEVVKNSHGSELSSIYGHLKCDIFEIVNVGDEDVYVDEEGLLKVDESTGFIEIDGYPQPIAGNGLILGLDIKTGESVSCHSTVEEVKSKVKFLTINDVRDRF
jgi:hypothetical protein